MEIARNVRVQTNASNAQMELCLCLQVRVQSVQSKIARNALTSLTARYAMQADCISEERRENARNAKSGG